MEYLESYRTLGSELFSDDEDANEKRGTLKISPSKILKSANKAKYYDLSLKMDVPSPNTERVSVSLMQPEDATDCNKSASFLRVTNENRTLILNLPELGSYETIKLSALSKVYNLANHPPNNARRCAVKSQTTLADRNKYSPNKTFPFATSSPISAAPNRGDGIVMRRKAKSLFEDELKSILKSDSVQEYNEFGVPLDNAEIEDTNIANQVDPNTALWSSFIDKTIKFHDRLTEKTERNWKFTLENMELKRKQKEFTLKSKSEEGQKLLDSIPTDTKHQDTFDEIFEVLNISRNEERAISKQNEIAHRQNMALLAQRMESVHNFYVNFIQIVELVNDKIRDLKGIKSLTTRAEAEMEEFRKQQKIMESVYYKLKNSEVDEECVNLSKNAVSVISSVNDAIASHINKLNEEEKEKAEKMNSTIPDSSKKYENAKPINDNEDSTDVICLNWYKEIQRHYKSVSVACEEITENPNLSSFRVKCQMDITTQVNLICGVKRSSDAFDRISSILRNKHINNLPNDLRPYYTIYCCKLAAEKILSHADHATTKKKINLTTLASIALSLWVDFPEFGSIFLAKITKGCSFAIPAYWSKLPAKRKDSKDPQGEVKIPDEIEVFLGNMRLYFAIFAMEPKCGNAHPHGLRFAWRWIVAVINIKPRPKVSVFLVEEFLKIVGNKMLNSYGKQFKKLLLLIYTHFVPRIEAMPEDHFAPIRRLKKILQDALSHGTISAAEE